MTYKLDPMDQILQEMDMLGSPVLGSKYWQDLVNDYCEIGKNTPIPVLIKKYGLKRKDLHGPGAGHCDEN